MRYDSLLNALHQRNIDHFCDAFFTLYGLDISPKNSFPSALASNHQHGIVPRDDTQRRCTSKIRYMFYHEVENLEHCLTEFESQCCRDMAPTYAALACIIDRLTGRAAPQTRDDAPLQKSFSSDISLSSNAATVFSAKTSRSTSAATSISSFATALQQPKVTKTDLSAMFHVDEDQSDDVADVQRPHETPSGFNADTDIKQSKEGDSIQNQACTLNGTAEALINYRLKTLPEQDFFFDSSSWTSNLNPDLKRPPPFFVKYECFRVSLGAKDPTSVLSELASKCEDTWSDHQVFKCAIDQILNKDAFKTLLVHCATSAWKAACANSSEISYSGKLTFAQSRADKFLFTLHLDPIKEQSNTCRLFRRYRGRFLRIRLPAHGHVPPHLTGSGASRDEFDMWYRQQLHRWAACATKSLFDRDYEAFAVKEIKNSRDIRRGYLEPDDNQDLEIMFFAVQGEDLVEKVSRQSAYNWFMPLTLNGDMKSLKAFKRLDLGFSMSEPTITFAPSQIMKVMDVISDGASEDAAFRDHAFNWSHIDSHAIQQVMNDGCSQISYAAALEIWTEKLGCLEEDLPSAFQARIGPAKGVWSVAKPGENKANDLRWVQLSESQCKWVDLPEPAGGNASTGAFSELHRCFEVVNYSKKPNPSYLYFDFLPILLDRHVPRRKIIDLVERLIHQHCEKFERTWDDKFELLAWSNAAASIVEDNTLDSGEGYGSWDSQTSSQKIKHLMMAGFEHSSFSQLRDLIHNLASSRFSKMREEGRLYLPNSTLVLGIADPTNTLKPGEIFFLPSEGFEGNAVAHFMHDTEVLVTRHPVLRASDIQKVRRVFKRELAHLQNVVVFPSRGCIPLAQSLQGGDYDGDLFWICWEEDLVHDFQNAPPPSPSQTLSLAQCGIVQDQRTLRQCFEDSDGDFFDHSFNFHLQPPMLGRVTEMHSRLSYSTKTIRSTSLDALADLHDLIIDSAKNGYIFTEQALRDFIGRLPDCAGATLAQRAQRKYKNPAAHEKALMSDKVDLSGVHIIDAIVFGNFKSIIDECLGRFKERFGKDSESDEDLTAPYLSLYRSSSSYERKLAQIFREAILNVTRKWPGGALQNMDHDERSVAIRRSFFSMREAWNEITSEALLLDNEDYRQDIQAWLMSNSRREHKGLFSNFERLKASAIYYAASKGSFIFELCWRELCFIKAHSTATPPMACVVPMYHHMKLKKPKKRAVPFDEPNNRDTDDVSEDSGGVSLVEDYEGDDDAFVMAVEAQGDLDRSDATAQRAADEGSETEEEEMDWAPTQSTSHTVIDHESVIQPGCFSSPASLL